MNSELLIITPGPEQAVSMIQLRAQLFEEELVRSGVGNAAAAQHVAPWVSPEGVAGYQFEIANLLGNSQMFIRTVLAPMYNKGLHIAGLFVAEIAAEEEPAHFVRYVQLHQSIRRHGVGRHLFQSFSDTAGTDRPIELDILECNDPAKRFYARLGFIGMRQYYNVMVGGQHGEKHTLMRLQLPGALEPHYDAGWGH
jgi:GNAT superfamily N-acetyltransferase